MAGMRSITAAPDPAPRTLPEAWREAAGFQGSGQPTPITNATVLHVGGRSGLAGDYQGEEAILGLVRLLEDLSDGQLLFTASRVVQSDRYAILTGRLRAGPGGEIGTIEAVFVVEFHDAEVDEIWMLYQDADAPDWVGAARSP